MDIITMHLVFLLVLEVKNRIFESLVVFFSFLALYMGPKGGKVINFTIYITLVFKE